MGLQIDLHVHTSRYSPCSRLDPGRLISQAVKVGLDGVVITEHHHQWSQEELDTLVSRSDAPWFLLLSGFEYSSTKGDMLVYGLDPRHTASFQPGWTPRRALEHAQGLGAACIAAHPTRRGFGFHEDLLSLPFSAIEVCSVNLELHEQRLAARLAHDLGIPPIAASDAHVLRDLGRHSTEFLDPIRSHLELHDALIHGRFRVVNHEYPKGSQ